MIRKGLLIGLGLMALLSGRALPQETNFGKNKVQYKNCDWQFIQTRHFDIYFYDNAYPTAKFAASVMESAYVEITSEVDYKIQRRVPVFVYNSQVDFQQTNIISSLIPEGVGGFTEAFKNRIVVPFSGSYEDFRHVLHHELTHAVVYDMLYGNTLSSILSQRRLFNLPLWYAEGYAEYSSRHGWDYFSDMFMRDATINSYLTPPDYLGGFLAYKQGQAMLKYIADTYGKEKIGDILQKGRVHLTMGKALKASINITDEQFWEGFSKEMKRRYWPEITKRKEADEIALQLTKARKDGSYFNEQPVFSPQGDKIAMFTDINDYTELVLISPVDGKKLARLVKGERSGDLESLHSYVSGMSFSPDGRDIAFVARSKGKDAIFFLDVAKHKIYKKKRFDYYNILSPAWSPDGKLVAFSALQGHKRDLFLYDITTEEITQLTDDRYDDAYPSWLPDSKELVFASDRPHPEKAVIDAMGHPTIGRESFAPGGFEYGNTNIFRIDLANKVVKPVDVGPGINRSPEVSPDGKKIAFISNRNGIDNIYIGFLDSMTNYAVTDILTGVQSISWSPKGDKLAFSAFFQGAFDVFVLKELRPAGDNGVLAPTDFVLGKYDQPIKKADTTAVASIDTTTVAAQDTATALAQADSIVTDSTKTDSIVAAAPKDTTATPSTGIVGDEYIVSRGHSVDPLDSLMTDLAEDSTSYTRGREEPAHFDSIQGVLPSGEYKIQKYKIKFTPDFVGGGFSYDTFFGLRGQSYFVLSDYLGNHQIYLATDLVNTIDQSNVQAYYFNNTKRTNFGGGIFHTKNFYLDNVDHLFSDRFYGAQAFISRPSSIFSRVEFIGAEYFIDRKYYDFDDTRPDRSSKVTTGTLSYVTDNILWGLTGPVNGRRAKLTVAGGVNLFDSGDIDFYAFELDYRKYWHFKKTFSFAFRTAGAASFGGTPKQYFLGGTTNWIGTRTLDAKVYDVENLYFSDVITPLRGVPYYSLSGDRFGLVNMELRFPLVQYLAMRYPLPIVLGNIGGALFMDMGTAWTDNNFKGGSSAGGSSHLQDIKTGFGFGMRANMFGIVLLRYDLAWSTDFQKVSDRPTHYFSFGADF